MKHSFENFRRSGFTLIEIIVVCSIIALLSSVAYSSFSGAREQARDKQRATILKQIQVALEAYKAEHGRYPEQGCTTGGALWATAEPVGGPDISACIAPNYIAGIASRPFVPKYMSSLPRDPRPFTQTGGTTNVGIMYRTDALGLGTAYKLMVYRSLESVSVEIYSEELARCRDSCGGVAHCDLADEQMANTYAVYGKASGNNDFLCW